MLVVPVIVEFNSESGTLSIGQRFTLSMVLMIEEGFSVMVKVFGLKLKTSGRKKPKKKAREKRKKTKVRMPGSKRVLLKGIVKSVTIRKLHLDIDTDDVVLNAQLIPLAYFLTNRASNRRFNINFQGVVLVQFILEIRLYLILIALAKSSLKR